MNTVMWSLIEGYGLEFCQIDTEPVTTLRGQVVTQLGHSMIAGTYQVQCDGDGTTKSVELSCQIDGRQRSLSISRTKDDRWFVNGDELPALAGLQDVDLGITPSTNTLPIRRLRLSPGESKEFSAAWLRFPELTFAALPQRYTCIDAETYLYESLKSGYRATLNVDSDGVVNVYEGHWKRINQQRRLEIDNIL